jgi:[ribulose-bisphosphate carboxylase]-lysine N-methyltransferase
LAEYHTTIEEDLDILGREDLSKRKEMAVVVRLGEKRVLEELQTWFEARLAGLDSIEYYADRRLRDLGLLDDKGFMTPWVFNE